MAQLLRRPNLSDDADAFAELTARVEAAATGLLTLSMQASLELPGGLSLTQLRALAAAERVGPCSLGTLAEALLITTSTASRLVDRLVPPGCSIAFRPR
jgi:DNA-binding MarR family transcriptional regulator